MQPVTRQGWRVMAWNAREMRWTVHRTVADHATACALAEQLQHKGRRVHVRPCERRAARPIAPPVNNETRQWRLAQAGAMSDRADANKKYKSPG